MEAEGSTIRAAVTSKHGGPEAITIEERPLPSPGPGEVRVRVRACALNHLDVWVRRGLPGSRFHVPIIGGADISGEISALGEGVTDIAHGQGVMVLPGVSCWSCPRCDAGEDHLCRSYGILGESQDGGLAEEIVVSSRGVVPTPERLSWEEAAALSLSMLTAWHMLVGRAALRSGETILVHGGASGVGSSAIQIAKHLGATVIATAGSESKLEAARSLGADHTIHYGEEDFVARVKELTSRRGADVIFEHVGGEVFERSLRCLAWAGRLVTCGATAGGTAQVDLRHLFFKSQSLLGSTMGNRAEYLELVRLYEAGHFRPLIHDVLPLEKVGEAHRLLEERQAIGKVVIRL
ncbi:MAG: zinc-binding dehydrogenase [Myxococcota bacterium]|nr:zinc-binding dehydrogenase [Myxococcota bacterium]